MRNEGGVARRAHDHDALPDIGGSDPGKERCRPGRQSLGRLANKSVRHRGLVPPQDPPHRLGEPRVVAHASEQGPEQTHVLFGDAPREPCRQGMHVLPETLSRRLWGFAGARRSTAAATSAALSRYRR